MQVPFYDLAAEHADLRAGLDAAWSRVMANGQFILGPELAGFEQEFAGFIGARHAIGVANGLEALRLSLLALGIGKGDEVIVPAHTFVATWLAVAESGATPVACEPAPGSFNIDAAGIEPLITPRTRAVIPVHLYGTPAPLAAIAQLCRARGIRLLEDAAQAHGAAERGVACGSMGATGCFSFYPSKNLGALGDGGAIVTSDDDLAARLRQLRNYGSKVKYHVEEVGYNSRLDELQAAFLRAKLKHLATRNADRQRVANGYLDRLSGIPALRVPVIADDAIPVWHLFVIRTPDRDALRDHLLAAGIQTGIHYPIPVYRMPPFRAFAPAAETETDRISREVLSLPLWPAMGEDQISRVCEEIARFFA